MEAYKKIAVSLSQPSAGFFFLSAAAVLAGHSSINNFHPAAIWAAVSAAVIFLCAGFTTVYRAGRGGIDTAVRCALFTAAAFGLAAVSYTRSLPQSEFAAAESSAKYEFKIIADKRGRYSRELVLLQPGPDARSGAAWVLPDTKLKVNDTVISVNAPAAVVPGPEGFTPMERDRLRRGLTFTLKLEDGSYERIYGAEDPRTAAVNFIASAVDSVFPAETAALLKGLYFGNKNYIDKKTISNMKRAGLMHLVAASGLHVGIVILIPFFIGKIFRIDIRVVSAAAFVLTAAYLFLAGAPVSLLRAVIMFGALALQRIFSLGGDPVNSLFAAAVIILVIDPADIYGLGFQLSFGATLGILLFYRLFYSAFKILPRKVASSFALTMSAQVFVTPVILLTLREINLAGIISNLIAIPLAGFILASSLPVLLLSAAHQGAASIAAAGIDIARQGLDLFTGMMASAGGHFSSVDATPFIAAMIVLMNLPLVPAAKHRFLYAMVPVLCMPLLWVNLSYAGDCGARLIMFRHAKGAASVIVQNGAARIGGDIPGYEGAVKISDELGRMGITTADLVIDKPDYRNMAGYSYMAKNFLVRECHLSSGFRMDRSVRNFFEVLEADKIEPVLRDFRPPASGGSTPDFLSPEFLRAAAESDPVEISALISGGVKVTEIVI